MRTLARRPRIRKSKVGIAECELAINSWLMAMNSMDVEALLTDALDHWSWSACPTADELAKTAPLMLAEMFVLRAPDLNPGLVAVQAALLAVKRSADWKGMDFLRESSCVPADTRRLASGIRLVLAKYRDLKRHPRKLAACLLKCKLAQRQDIMHLVNQIDVPQCEGSTSSLDMDSGYGGFGFDSDRGSASAASTPLKDGGDELDDFLAMRAMAASRGGSSGVVPSSGASSGIAAGIGVSSGVTASIGGSSGVTASSGGSSGLAASIGVSSGIVPSSGGSSGIVGEDGGSSDSGTISLGINLIVLCLKCIRLDLHQTQIN